YNNADIFYCPSSYEAFGFTFVEAAFFGLPIIASNVEGIPEVVIHGKMGFLTAPDDYIDQANFIERLLYDNELYEEFSKYGKKYVVNNFSLPTSLSSYISLYNETCGKKK
ncbi:TPA: glycosyltransferase, partial [Escherichia coli]